MSKPSTPIKAAAAGKSRPQSGDGRNVSRPLNTDGTAKSAPPIATGPRARSGRRYVRQKATFEGRRDDRAVIFNLGRGLPSSQKTRIQRRLYLAFAGVIIAAILGVVAFGYINLNYIQPGQPILTVNGKPVEQRMFRYMVAYLAQNNWNQLQADQRQAADLQAQITKDPTKKDALTTQIATLQTNITSLQTAFSQTQVDQLAIDNLTEDQLIQAAGIRLAKADPKLSSTFTVSNTEVNTMLDAFKKAFPAGSSYGDFLSKNALSTDNVKAAILVKLRREKMDAYQQSLVTSPTRQIHGERIQYDTLQKAKDDLAKLKAGTAKWEDLAKADSIDTNTRDKGGDIGWFALGQQDQNMEAWAFDPQRKVNDISDVITEISGLFDLVRIREIDNARPLDASTVTSQKSNALSHWLTGERNHAKIGPTNQDMYNSPSNVPVTPKFVTSSSTSSSSAPGGGLPIPTTKP